MKTDTRYIAIDHELDESRNGMMNGYNAAENKKQIESLIDEKRMQKAHTCNSTSQQNNPTSHKNQLEEKFFALDNGVNFHLEKFDLPGSPPTLTKHKIQELNLNQKEIERILRKSSLLTDITSLLPLPQKIAAAKLGISESMFCKRFRERTNKKWPYRYLKKIERDLENANTEEEKKNLTKLREEYLSPVSIRVRRYRTQKEIDEFTSFDPEENEVVN